MRSIVELDEGCDDRRGGEQPTPQRWATGLTVSVASLFFALYVYNTIRFDKDSLRGDQWIWVEHVLEPLERGETSLFDAVTYEYANLAHSHILTLAAFILNARVFGLDLTVDAVVGITALLATLGVVLRHGLQEMTPRRAAFSVAAASSLLFMSSDSINFLWSLLQFQMLYIFIAVLYLYLFARQAEQPSATFAVIAIPTTVILGDAIGVAAVVSGMLYLGGLVVLRKVPVRRALPFPASFFGALAIGSALRGDRYHGGQPLTEFLEHVASQPGEMLTAASRAVSGSLVGLRTSAGVGPPLLHWDVGWVWFLVTALLVGIAAVALRRVGVNRCDHFPLLLMLASLIWTGGVMKSRLWLAGPAALQTPRYVPYTTLFGLGLIILIAGKWPTLGRGRFLAGAAIVAAVAANGVGSVAVALDDRGVRQQDRELTSTRRFVAGDIERPQIRQLECGPDAPCLEAGWFLAEQELGPFSDEPSRVPSWLVAFRAAVFAGLERVDQAERAVLCQRWFEDSSERAVVDDLLPVLRVPAYLDERGVSLEPSDLDQALQSFQRVMQSTCATLRPADP